MAEPLQKTGRADTKLELLIAAERLFATKGFDATTVKEITEASGQRNQSVIHYHFGSREAILDAILELRVGPMNEARERLRAKLLSESAGLPLTSEQICRLLVNPTLDRILNEPGPHYASRLSLQLRVNRDLWRKYQLARTAWTLDDVHVELLRSRPYMPREIVRSRFRNIVLLSMVAIAELEQVQERMGPKFSSGEARFRIEEMVSAMCGIIDAPVSPAALDAFERASSSDTGLR